MSTYKNGRMLASAAVVAVGVAASLAQAAPAQLNIPGTGIYPESLTSSKDGTIYIGSAGKGEIYRVKAGGDTAEPFIRPGTGGITQVFGVLADDASGTLWACSNTFGGPPPAAGAPPPAPNALHSFDLKTGAHKAQYAMPPTGMCNDIAVGTDGSAYVSDTQGMQVLRLPKGGKQLETWAGNGAFGPPGGVLDGIAVVNGQLIVNTLITSKLFSVDIGKDGKAGKVTELKLSSPVTRPDGMRSIGKDTLLTTDGTGKVHKVAVKGDTATVTTLKGDVEGIVAITLVGDTVYALEGQLARMMAAPGGPPPPAEKPYRAVALPLK